MSFRRHVSRELVLSLIISLAIGVALLALVKLTDGPQAQPRPTPTHQGARSFQSLTTTDTLIDQAKAELLLTTKSGQWYSTHLGSPGHWTNAWNLLALAGAPAPAPPPASCVEPTNPATDRWYACASSFNTPIPASVAIHPNSASFVQGMVNDRNSAGYSPLTPSAKWERVAYVDSTPTVPLQRNCCGGCNTELTQAPLPASFVPWESGESHALLMNRSDGSEWNIYELSRPGIAPLHIGSESVCAANANWQSQVFAKHVPGWKGTGYDPATDTRGYRGSKINAGAGLIRTLDMAMPAGSTWPHALSLALYPTSNGTSWPRFVAPARAGDGTVAAGTPEGARVQLDPSFDVGAQLAGQPEWKKMFARTLQTYGAIVVDTGRETFREGPPSGADPWLGLSGWNGTDTHMPDSVLSHLRVIDWTRGP